MSDRIVVIDPDNEFVTETAAILRPHGASVAGVASIGEFEATTAEAAPDLLIVSLDAAADTRALLEWLRATVRPETAVLLVFPQRALPESSAWFAGRVDDFVTRPVDAGELALRAERLIERSRQAAPEPRVGPLAFDAAAHAIRADGTILGLSPTELRVMVFFLENPERAFTRAELLREVWGEGLALTERTVDVTIRRLRAVLAEHDCSAMIQTVRGIGYRFSDSAGAGSRRSKSTG